MSKMGPNYHKKDENNGGLVIAIILIILAIAFNKQPPLPEGCHLTPSVDVGGSEVECD